ncbi:MAG: hypothetical protein ACRD2H_13140 [Terriglobales bacterium]
MWFDLRVFAESLFKKWTALLLGGALGFALGILQGFGLPIRPLQYAAILVGAFVFAAFAVWRDEFKRGQFLKQENTILGGLLKTERARADKLAEDVRTAKDKAPSPIWRPAAELHSFQERTELVNELVVKDSSLFELQSVELLSPNDAKLATVVVGPALYKEYHIRIPHSAIIESWNRRFRQGFIAYRARRGPSVWEAKLPFVAEELFIASTQWVRLVG